VHRAEKRLLPVAEAFRQFLLKESGGLDKPPKETGAEKKPPSAASGSSRARPKKAAGRSRR
jgi:hypothetical protein